MDGLLIGDVGRLSLVDLHRPADSVVLQTGAPGLSGNVPVHDAVDEVLKFQPESKKLIVLVAVVDDLHAICAWLGPQREA